MLVYFELLFENFLIPTFVNSQLGREALILYRDSNIPRLRRSKLIKDELIGKRGASDRGILWFLFVGVALVMKAYAPIVALE